MVDRGNLASLRITQSTVVVKAIATRLLGCSQTDACEGCNSPVRYQHGSETLNLSVLVGEVRGCRGLKRVEGFWI